MPTRHNLRHRGRSAGGPEVTPVQHLRSRGAGTSHAHVINIILDKRTGLPHRTRPCPRLSDQQCPGCPRRREPQSTFAVRLGGCTAPPWHPYWRPPAFAGAFRRGVGRDLSLAMEPLNLNVERLRSGRSSSADPARSATRSAFVVRNLPAVQKALENAINMVIVVVARDLVVVIVSMQGDRAVSLSNFPRSRVPQKRRLVVEKSSCRHCSCYRQESRAAPLSNFPRSRVPQKMGLVVVEGKCRCRRCSCYRQEDRAASLSNFPRSRSTERATRHHRGRKQLSSLHLLQAGGPSC